MILNKKNMIVKILFALVPLFLLATPVCAEMPLAGTAAKTAVENKKAEQQTPNKQPDTNVGQGNAQSTEGPQASPSTFGSVFDSAKQYFLKPFEYIQEAWETMHFAKKAEQKITGEDEQVQQQSQPQVHSSKVEDGKKEVLALAPEPASHEAVYNIQFIAEEGSDYSDTKGQMTIEMVRYDGNWITKQTSTLEIMSPDGEPMRTSTFLSTLESNNSLEYKFAAEANADSVVQERIQGSARMASPDGKGTVVYDAPEEINVPLPASTVFPIKHMKMLMDAGSKIRDKSFQIVKATVFDGSSDVHDAVRVEAIVTPLDPKTKEVKIDAALRPKKLWRAEMRIFTLDNKTAEPDYTITQVFSDQGILFDVVVDYGDYKMVSTLTHLKVYTDGDVPAALKFEGFGLKPASMKAEDAMTPSNHKDMSISATAA